jgi:hypothetical protein
MNVRVGVRRKKGRQALKAGEQKEAREKAISADREERKRKVNRLIKQSPGGW